MYRFLHGLIVGLVGYFVPLRGVYWFSCAGDGWQVERMAGHIPPFDGWRGWRVSGLECRNFFLSLDALGCDCWLKGGGERGVRLIDRRLGTGKFVGHY